VLSTLVMPKGIKLFYLSLVGLTKHSEKKTNVGGALIGLCCPYNERTSMNDA
jgi:hypothetical protein